MTREDLREAEFYLDLLALQVSSSSQDAAAIKRIKMLVASLNVIKQLK